MSWPAIGAVFAGRRARAAAAAYGLGIVAIDFATIRHDLILPRWILAPIALFVAMHLAMRDPRAAEGLGWRRLTADERRWGLRLVAGYLVLAAIALWVVVGVGLATDAPLVEGDLWQGSALDYAVWAIVVWPVYEECIYRVALVPAVVAAFGRWIGLAIAIAAFCVLHVLYGNFGPGNAAGAVILNLAFLRTGSVAVTLGLHALGNAVIVAGNLAAAWA